MSLRIYANATVSLLKHGPEKTMSTKDQKLQGKSEAESDVETSLNNESSIDRGRRRALKVSALSLSGVSLAGMASVSQAVPCGDYRHNANALSTTVENPNETSDQISLKVRHSWAGNDLAVVLTNKSQHNITITEIAPARVSLPRGEFDFAHLLNHGSLTLMPGESTEVPLQPYPSRPATVDAGYSLVSAAVSTGYGHFDRSVQQQLKSRISITTSENKLASVTVVPGPVVG